MVVGRGAPPARGVSSAASVPLAEGPIERRHPALRTGHERYRAELLSGRLVGEFVALTPVHVGTGGLVRTAVAGIAGAEEAALAWAHARSGGVPVLPGSTLKGAVRSVVEAVAATCVSVRARSTLLPLTVQPCRRHDELCVGCRLFGAPGYAGRFQFGDARRVGSETMVARAPRSGAPPQVEGRRAPGRRFYRHGRPRRGTVPVEVCPEGSRFRWTLDFVNLVEAELGLVLLALGQGEAPLRLKLGGYRAWCFGSVRFDLTGVRVDNPSDAFLRYDGDDAGESDDNGSRGHHVTEGGEAPLGATQVDVSRFREALAASGLVPSDQLDRLAAILEYPVDQDCGGGA